VLSLFGAIPSSDFFIGGVFGNIQVPKRRIQMKISKDNVVLVTGTIGILVGIELLISAISIKAEIANRVLAMVLIPTAFVFLHLMWLEEDARKRMLDASKKIIRWRAKAKVIHRT
jgi:uncharacterized membrane protein